MMGRALAQRLCAGARAVVPRIVTRVHPVCDEFQGFLYAKPMPPAGVDAWVRARGRAQEVLRSLTPGDA